MPEIAFVIGLIAFVFLVAWIQSLGPLWMVGTAVALLNLINLAMTGINLQQARKRDPRFMNPYHLGLIQLAVGIGLGGWLAVFGSPDYLTLGTAVPFAVGGILVILYRAIQAKTPPPGA